MQLSLMPPCSSAPGAGRAGDPHAALRVDGDAVGLNLGRDREDLVGQRVAVDALAAIHHAHAAAAEHLAQQERSDSVARPGGFGQRDEPLVHHARARVARMPGLAVVGVEQAPQLSRQLAVGSARHRDGRIALRRLQRGDLVECFAHAHEAAGGVAHRASSARSSPDFVAASASKSGRCAIRGAARSR